MVEPITATIALLSLGGQAISTLYGVVSEGVPSEVAGGETHNFVRKNFEQLKDNLNRHLPYLNHDLQRAIRLAYLQATLQVCAIRLQEHGVDETKLKSYLRRRFPTWLKRKEPLGIFAQGEVEWLDKVCVWIDEEIRRLKSEEIPPLTVDKKDLGLLMQPTNAPIAELKSLRGQLIEKVVDELKAKHGKLPDDFYSLMTKGWTQVNKNGTDLKQDWFDLFCLSFQHEAKKKSDIRIDFQNEILARLTFQNGNTITFDQVTDALAQSNAEMAKKLDEATNLLKEKFDAGFENLNERFDELAPVLALADDIPAGFDSLANLIRAESQRVIDEVSDRIKAVGNRIVDELKGRIIQEETFEVILASFNINAAVYGREDECEEVLQALRGGWRDDKGVLSNNRVWLLSASSSFGKTYLATKGLQEVINSDTRKIKDTNVKKVAVLECRGVELTDFIGTLGSLVGYGETLKSLFAELSDEDKKDEIKLKRWLNENLFKHTESAGTVWLVFDNFEALLTEDDYRIKDEKIRIFIESLATNPRNFRVLILTQSVPQIRGVVLPQLKAGEKLLHGLDEKAALEYLKNELPNESDDLLKQFAEKVFYLPMPMNTLTGYLKTTGRGLKEVLDENSDGFRFFEKKEIEEGTKFFIRRQIEVQPDRMKRLLCALTFFAKPLPIEALEPLLDKKEQDPRETIKRLETHNLAERTTGSRKTIRYNLHAYFRKETETELLPEYISIFDKSYFWKLISSGNENYKDSNHRRAIDMFECAEMICHLFLNKDKSNQEWRNILAAAYMNKGNALYSLGRLNEAIESYDKAIEILERLVVTENRTELSNYLASAYANKALVFEKKEDWDAALVCYENALKYWAFCCEQLGMYWLMPDLLQFLRYRLMTLLDLQRWQDAAQDVSRFLSLYSPFVADAEIHDGLKGRATRELDSMIDSLRGLSDEEREEVFAKLTDEETETIRRLMDTE